MGADHSSIDFVRANRELFLGPSGTIDLRELAGRLITDVVCLGICPVQVDCYLDWFVVFANDDWLSKDPSVTPNDAFFRLKRFPQHRPNSHRTTLLIAAFCSDVFTIDSLGLPIVIKGVRDEVFVRQMQEISERYKHPRVVVFRGVDA